MSSTSTCARARSAWATWSIAAGARIAIDGSTGTVTRDDVPLVEASRSARFERVLGWADEIRRLGVRANADTPADARKAIEHGAEGIGLCRTEHMFMAADRQPKMRAMIMARTEPERRAALAELLPLQQADFEGLFAAMPGRPMTIRLLDPPLHEFLPDRVALAQRVQKARDEKAVGEALGTDGAAPELAALEQELELVLRLGEVNPMLGTRGCRLGIVHPEIYEMQVEAIMRAAKAAAEPPQLEIMIPLVDFEAELHELRAMVLAVGERHGLREGEDYIVGTMIELPRACFIADRLAAEADVLLLRHQRPDADRARVLARRRRGRASCPAYLERRILERSPFESIDVDGVGALVEIAVRLGREPARGHRARRLRRARRRPRFDRVLPPRRARLRVLLALPAPDRPRRRRAGRARGLNRARPRRRRHAAARSLRRRAVTLGGARAAPRRGARAHLELAGRRIWNVNSTARGGGVAEMLAPAARVRARLGGRRPLGGDRRRPGVLHDHQAPAQPAARHAGRRRPARAPRSARLYEAALAAPAARAVRAASSPATSSCLHDPQTAGLIPAPARARRAR